MRRPHSRHERGSSSPRANRGTSNIHLTAIAVALSIGVGVLAAVYVNEVGFGRTEVSSVSIPVPNQYPATDTTQTRQEVTDSQLAIQVDRQLQDMKSSFARQSEVAPQPKLIYSDTALIPSIYDGLDACYSSLRTVGSRLGSQSGVTTKTDDRGILLLHFSKANSNVVLRCFDVASSYRIFLAGSGNSKEHLDSLMLEIYEAAAA